MDISQTPPFYIFVADIGGTNANFGIINEKNNKYELIASYNQPSQKINDFTQTVYELLEKITAERHIRFSVLIFGIAAAVYKTQHAVRPTNLPFFIDKAKLQHKIGIQEILFINDFAAVVCGHHLVQNTIAINNVVVKEHAQKAFIGAGTGLGQAGAIWLPSAQKYIPISSEGGHSEFVPYDHFDHQLQEFVQEQTNVFSPITWENILSGYGISDIYKFLGTLASYTHNDISQEIEAHGFQPDFISKYSHLDERCKKTFDVYVNYYARFAKQVALQGAAYSGLYIAGGIAAKNKELFTSPQFLREFTHHGKHRKLLEAIPIFLIQDYQVNLYGGAYYYTLYKLGIV